MTQNLRPLGLGEILDRAISIYRKNFVMLLGIVAVLSIPILAFEVIAGLLALPFDPFRPGNFISPSNSSAQLTPFLIIYGILIGAALLQGIASIFQTGALVVAVSDAYHELHSSIKQAYSAMLSRWASLLLALIIIGLVDIAIYAAMFLPMFGSILAGSLLGTNSSSAGAATLSLFGLSCLLFIPGLLLLIFINVRWIFNVQTIMLEKLNAVNGLRRSWNLISGSFFRVLLISFLLSLFVGALTIGPSYVVSFSSAFLLPESVVLSTVVNSVFNTLIMTFVAPIQVAVLTVLYYDLRVRREGYDLDLKMQP